jgi:adenylate kinase family enzyme
MVRHDDREEVIRERLREYNAQTLPVIQHYTHRNYCRIQGDRSPQQIFDTMAQYLEPFVAATAR